ncbi:MAG: AAA family ATPase [Saprospiraceae bacterium]
MKIGVSNLKGGVGKTTVSQNLAVCLAHLGYKVCLVDTDRNQNSIEWSGVRDENLPQILTVGVIDAKALTKNVDRLDLDNDFVIIDGTPSLSEMTTRIILASDLMLIPTLASAHDIRAMRQFVERYEQAKEFKDSIPAYFFFNQFSPTFNIHKNIKGILEKYGIPIMECSFKERVAYIESAVDGRGVYEFSDDKAKAEVVQFTKEVLGIAEELGFIGG